jgi:signal transduction histidine kinase/CHASE3 domain sensor protein
MKSTYLYKSSLVIKIALGTAIMLIAYITFIFFTQMQNLGESVESMSVSNKRLMELERILSVISVNETSVRSYIITGDTLYLKKRFRGKETLAPALDELRNYPKNPHGNFNPDTLKAMIDKRYRLFTKALQQAKRDPDYSHPTLNYAMAQGDSISDKIREYVYRSLDMEASNVDQYEINHRYEIETSIITSFLLVTIALFILLLSLNRISSDLDSMKKLNDELRFLNYTFNNAEKIAGISHWKYNLKTGKYSFSDNFFNLAGLNPATFKPTLETILPYLHPDDRQNVIDAYSDSLQNRTPTSLVFRLYRTNGEMKYIKSVGSFAENSVGELVKIGVNYDITEQYLNTVSLEENNRNLRTINAELESFNNIVSHDLQEPLRKIQMFVSRIDENEFSQLSEGGRQYFHRIAATANRMQELLIDLVNYSRTIKGDRAFDVTDLSAIAADVVNEQSISIEEKNAVVEIGALPVLKVIPFQIHQLLMNLLSNALKFTRPCVNPEISIAEEAISESESYRGISFNAKDYVKLVVSDNGIGFKQEFSDHIFQLFRRLEKEHYSGTGIGLAICKKIADNHNGYIFAESKPGKGSRFMVYLPKEA